MKSFNKVVQNILEHNKNWGNADFYNDALKFPNNYKLTFSYQDDLDFEGHPVTRKTAELSKINDNTGDWELVSNEDDINQLYDVFITKAPNNIQESNA